MSLRDQQVGQWTSRIVEDTVKRLTALQKNFKYVGALRRTIAGLPATRARRSAAADSSISPVVIGCELSEVSTTGWRVCRLTEVVFSDVTLLQ